MRDFAPGFDPKIVAPNKHYRKSWQTRGLNCRPGIACALAVQSLSNPPIIRADAGASRRRRLCTANCHQGIA